MLHEGWAVVCQAGLWGWIASTTVLIVKAFPTRGAMNGKAAGLWGLAVVAFFSLWIMGMVMA